jgi:hypothetical protein
MTQPEHKTYRIRVTEYTDVEATSKAEALKKFHDDLSGFLNSGSDLDTDVSIVETDSDGNETES